MIICEVKQMTENDYKYIENRLNEMCKHDVKIVYDKTNSKSFYNGNDINFDKIILKIYRYGSHTLSISRKLASYTSVINLLYNKYLEVTK